jgi:predicted acylesterase/phospholipase RssA
MSNINNEIDMEIDMILGRTSDVKRDILVLSGGSVKGIAQLGALYCLEKHGLLEPLKIFSCTSIGSVVAVLIVAGYKPLEIFKLFKLIDVDKIRDLNPVNLLTDLGLSDGKRMMIILEKMLENKKFSRDITFIEFYKRTKKTLMITGTCVNEKKLYRFSHKNYPNMKILEAVRISISLPILFTPCKFENKLFIDGGFIDNYPIRIFNHDTNRVIGIHVSDQSKQVDQIMYIEDYLVNTIGCILKGVSYMSVTGFEDCTISINCIDSGTTIENFISMFEDGYQAAAQKINHFIN